MHYMKGLQDYTKSALVHAENILFGEKVLWKLNNSFYGCDKKTKKHEMTEKDINE